MYYASLTASFHFRVTRPIRHIQAVLAGQAPPRMLAADISLGTASRPGRVRCPANVARWQADPAAAMGWSGDHGGFRVAT